MRRFLIGSALALLLGTPRASQAAPTDAPAPVGVSVHQLLLVKGANWSSAAGTLQRYERDEASPWHEVGGIIPVSLGRHGLAWGRGLQPTQNDGPTKHEGDGRSPAGVFALETAFGAAATLPSGARGFPYLQATTSTYCVEDLRSPHYNELVDSAELKPKAWQRWSPLRRPDGLFRFGVVVRQNSPDILLGAGSCVFLHVWRGEHQPTVGCTAMAAESIAEILRWLDAKADPVLVQLPEPVYESLRSSWALPAEDTAARASK